VKTQTVYRALIIILAFGLCSCGKDGTSACAVPNDPANSPAEACAPGEIWVTSAMASFNAFCGKVCAYSSDCPSGADCVTGLTSSNYPGAVCVSDQVPTARCGTVSISQEGPDLACLDAETLGTKYVNNRTGLAGYKVVKCPNGCQGGIPDGGIQGFRLGSCL
jgi:hypothetical protein